MAERKTKTGGRVKGTPNRITGEMRELISDICHEKHDVFVRKLDEVAEVDPGKYCDIYVKLLTFVTPRLNAVSVDNSAAVDDMRAELAKIASEEIH